MQLNEVIQNLIDDSEDNLNTLAELVDWINGQWISLEDNPPPHNGSYIIAWETDAGRFSGGAVYKDGHWYWDGGFLIYGVKITHYMPFPEPPKGETT